VVERLAEALLAAVGAVVAGHRAASPSGWPKGANTEVLLSATDLALANAKAAEDAQQQTQAVETPPAPAEPPTEGTPPVSAETPPPADPEPPAPTGPSWPSGVVQPRQMPTTTHKRKRP
jgi:hypothetical protein